MKRTLLVATTVVLVSGGVACSLPVLSRSVGEDPRAGLNFTRAATLQSTSAEFGPAENGNRQYLLIFRACRILDERGRRTTTQRTRYFFSPRTVAGGLKVAVLDDVQMDEIWRSPRIQRFCEPHLVLLHGYPSSINLSGQSSPETPALQFQVEPRNDGTFRIKFEPLSMLHYNQLTVDSITVDAPISGWVAIPCTMRGTEDESESISMSEKADRKLREDLLLFVKVENVPPVANP
jgi:hypothetical protein